MASSALSGAATGAATGAAAGPWGALIGGAIGLLGGLMGGSGGGQAPTAQQGNFMNFQTQRFLPRVLRSSNRGGVVDPFIRSGLLGIGNLIQNPGGLDANVASAIGPRLAIESERIGRDVRGQQSQASGQLARAGLGNSPFAAALSTAIERAGARDMATGRRAALAESAQLRREDLSRVFDLLNAQLSFINSGRGIQAQQIASQSAIAGQNRAANAASLSGLVQGLLSANFGGGSSNQSSQRLLTTSTPGFVPGGSV